MLIKTIEDKENGKKWEIFKKSDNEYFYKYYEYFKQCGWKFTAREGDHKNGYMTKDLIEWEFDILVSSKIEKINELKLKSYFRELNNYYKKTEEECRIAREEWENKNPPETLLKREVEELHNKLQEGGVVFDFKQFRFCIDKNENIYEILEYLDGYCCAGLSHIVTYESFTKLVNWYIENEIPAIWNLDNNELRNQYEELIINELNNIIETVEIR